MSRLDGSIWGMDQLKTSAVSEWITIRVFDREDELVEIAWGQLRGWKRMPEKINVHLIGHQYPVSIFNNHRFEVIYHGA